MIKNKLPEGWIEVSLKDVCNIKYWKDHKKLSDWKIPCYWSGWLMRNVNKFLYDKPSVLIPRKWTISNLFYITEPFWTVDTLFYTEINEKKVFHKFFYYKLKIERLEELNTGSAVPSLTTSVLNQHKIIIPENIEMQKSIAKILSSFDDKIELLREQNETLENIGQEIFKEWFGKYKVGDELLEGWRVGKLGDISDLKSWYAFKSKDFVNTGNNKALKIKDLKWKWKVNINDISSISDDVIKLERVQYFKLSEWNIVLAMSWNTTWKIGITPRNNWNIFLNQRVWKFFVKDDSFNSFLYFFLMSWNYEEIILNMWYWSAQPNISPWQIKNISLIIPNQNKLNEFLKISDNLFKKILENNYQIQELEKSRDLILPRLMKGEVLV